MFGLRFVCFAVAALLCGITNVAAVPVPYHVPVRGEIVYAAASDHIQGGSHGVSYKNRHGNLNPL